MVNCFREGSSQKMKFLFVVILVVVPSYVLGRRRNGKVIAVESFEWNMDASSNYRPGRKLPVRIDFVAQMGSQSNSVNGENLWRLGIFGNEHNDGHGERVGYKSQILQTRQISKSATRGQPLRMRNILTRFDLSQIGCSDLPYLCVEFAKNSDSTVDFELRSGSALNSIVSCKELECRRPNTDIASLEGRESLRESQPNRLETPEEELTTSHPKVSIVFASFGYCLEIDLSAVSITASFKLNLDFYVPPTGGTGLWRLGVFLSNATTGSMTKAQYHHDVLNAAQKAKSFIEGRMVNFPKIKVPLNTTGVGCSGSDLRYLCIEIDKGENPVPNFDIRGPPAYSCRSLICRQPISKLHYGRPTSLKGVKLISFEEFMKKYYS